MRVTNKTAHQSPAWGLAGMSLDRVQKDYVQLSSTVYQPPSGAAAEAWIVMSRLTEPNKRLLRVQVGQAELQCTHAVCGLYVVLGYMASRGTPFPGTEDLHGVGTHPSWWSE